ncbi:AraC family transcriptional regulator [Streptomyces sp. NA04227]|uniref:AraC family transcriptional regulator n=1 Tax=Streptomyces sp. NA04227 TaxID=2742136 RepID=UPI001591FB4F|nr:AraC family transcriptional regulator [Streptomyces sp. NA04227]QKW10114.1 AraC family transcriptional regulator [Streptomyces sp. NA04227]
MASQTVPIHFVQRLLRYAEARGQDVRPLLRDAGIPPDVAGNPLARVTAAQMARATQALWELTDDELWGLGRAPVPRGTFRMVGTLLVHAADLRGVLSRFEHATNALPGVPSGRVLHGRPITRVEVDLSDLDDPEHLGGELVLSMLHRVAGWLIGRRIPLQVLEMPYPEPRYAADYDKVFGRIPVFDAPVAALGFDSALLVAPVVRDEADLARYVRDSPFELFHTRDYGSSTSDQVRKILEQGLQGSWPNPEDMAHRLGMSLQHLRRLLRDEGTSMSAIKEEILRDAAIASMVRGTEPVEDLATRLGYSEASALRRAFRRWTGSNLGDYRSDGTSRD